MASESARVPKATMAKYRKWAERSGRTLTKLIDTALRYAEEHASEVERKFQEQPK